MGQRLFMENKLENSYCLTFTDKYYCSLPQMITY
jgi:hypothetical protein